MNSYEKMIKALTSSVVYDPDIIVMIMACVRFTADSLVDSDTEVYFKKEYGERMHRTITGMIEFM